MPVVRPRTQRAGAAGSGLDRLTDLLTKPVGTWETTRDTGDAQRGLCLVSETRRNVRDGGDARRMAHNPEVAGSNPAPATRQDGSPEVIWRAVFVAHVTNFVTSGCVSPRCVSPRCVNPPHRPRVPRL